VVWSYRPNPFYLCDTTGNVWEWVWDRWEDRYTPAGVNPMGPLAGRGRVYRGGSWFSTPWVARVAYRDGFSPGLRVRYLGFRVARSFPSAVLPSHPLPPDGAASP
jgi:formylglycine-generating enzyme required for sulfatase activity